MSIPRFCEASDPGAVDITKTWNLQSPMFVNHYAVGCVYSLGERNGYNDSDFYAHYWDDETETLKQAEYATTRGWCYPVYGAFVDITPERLVKVEAYLARCEKVGRVRRKLEKRNQDRQLAERLGVSRFSLLRLKGAVSRSDFENAITFLKTNPRKEFRKSLKRQLVEWLNDPDPKYPTPLSPRQLAAIQPYIVSRY